MREGDKVVCVDDSDNGGYRTIFGGIWIKKDRIYCVRGIDTRSGPNLIGLYLIGIVPMCPVLKEEVSWSATRFRRIVPASERVSIEQSLHEAQAD